MPYDLVQRADREGGEVEEMVDQSVQINVARAMHFINRSGALLSGIAGFVLAAIAVAGFWFWVEFYQALFMLIAPHFLVLLLAVRLAIRLDNSSVGFSTKRRVIRNED